MAARFKALAQSELSEAQKAVYEAIASGPRGSVRGPFNALLRSPELAERAQKLGEFIRFNTSLPPALNELAILVTARHWGAQFEWYAHAKLAQKAGLAQEVISAISERKEPKNLSEEEAAIYDFCIELHEKKHVSDTAFDAVVGRFGERGAIELVGVCGYYTLVSMVLNVDRHPLPEGAAPPLK